MPATNDIYAYNHLLRFGQTLRSSLLLNFIFALIPLFKGDPFDFWLFVDGILFVTILLYLLHYHHIFNAGVCLFRNELQIKRILVDDQIFNFSELRRIRFLQLPAHPFIFASGSRLQMTLVDDEGSADLMVSDLQQHQAFIEAVELLAEENGVRVSWQNEKGEFVTTDSDPHQISL